MSSTTTERPECSWARSSPTGRAPLPVGTNALLLATNEPFARIVRFNGSTGAFIDVFTGWITEGSIQDLVFGPDGHLYIGFVHPEPGGGFSYSVRRFHGATGAFLGFAVAPASGWRFAAGEENLAFKPRPVTKQIDTLLVAVEKLQLPSDIETSLSSSLRTAPTAVDTGRVLLARNQLDAFTEKVRPNLGNLIPVPQANRLIFDVNAIKAYLPCS